MASASPRPQQVLSLEDQCLLHLVCRLEEFPPESLASLPHHLRRRLLLSLPAVDVFQLQNLTSVTQGIDMDESVWKPLVELRSERSKLKFRECFCLPTFLEDAGYSDFASSYLDICFARLFAGYLQDARVLLFSAIGCLGVDNWEDVPHNFATLGRELDYPTPQRHVKHLADKCREAYLTAFLVETCKCTPTRIPIDCRKFSTLMPEAGLMSQCLGRVQALCFLCLSWEDVSAMGKVVGLPRQVIQLALSNPKRSLRQLKLSGTTEFIRQVVNDMMGILSPVDACVPADGSPYSGLSRLEIRLENYAGLFKEEEKQVHYQLQSIVRYQTALTSLTLDQWDTNGRGESTPSTIIQLYSWLGALFHQPQFKELNLVSVFFNFDMLNALIPEFFASKCQGGEKVLCLKKPHFQCSQLPSSLGSVATGVCAHPCSLEPPRKSLIISDTEVTSDYADCIGVVFQWLTSLRFSQFLSSFQFASLWMDVELMDDEDFDEVTAIFGVDTALDMLLGEQSQHVPIPAVFFQGLFGPHLKELSFRYHYLGPTHLLPALTEGLLAQESRELRSLNLQGCGLGNSQESDLLAFFDVLFSLPQLSQLELNLMHNELEGQHFSLMYQSWKNAHSRTTKRLKHLMVGGNKYEDHMTKLQEIAAGGDFVEVAA